jgi:uncharacterized alpha-E superfamily protein
MPMLSRVAESIFWIARYVERAENTARLLDVSLRASREWPMPGAVTDEQGASRVALAATGLLDEYERRVGAVTEDGLAAFLMVDLENASSVIACIAAARANARSVREAISSEMWEEINRIHLVLQPVTATFRLLDSVHDFCRQVRVASQTFQGIASATLPRDEGWHFFQAGTYLERALMTARILDAHAHAFPAAGAHISPEEIHRWLTLLRSVSAYEAYTRSVGGGVRPLGVAEFLLFSARFPRAVSFGVGRLRDELRAIDDEIGVHPAAGPHTLTAILADQLDDARRRGLALPELSNLVRRTERECNLIGDAVRRAYFENLAASLVAS